MECRLTSLAAQPVVDIEAVPLSLLAPVSHIPPVEDGHWDRPHLVPLILGLLLSEEKEIILVWRLRPDYCRNREWRSES